MPSCPHAPCPRLSADLSFCTFHTSAATYLAFCLAFIYGDVFRLKETHRVVHLLMDIWVFPPLATHDSAAVDSHVHASIWPPSSGAFVPFHSRPRKLPVCYLSASRRQEETPAPAHRQVFLWKGRGKTWRGAAEAGDRVAAQDRAQGEGRGGTPGGGEEPTLS